MRTMHPTVLVGPADWDPERLPRQEFSARIAALFEACGAEAALVYGDPARHAELLYLTHCLPKLDRTIALIPRAGAPRLLFGGGASMIGSVRPLTWIEDLEPLRGGAQAALKWVGERMAQGQRVVLVGAESMPAAWRRELASAGPLEDVTPQLRACMRRKRPREIALMRESCATLQAAAAALVATHAAGAGATAAVLAAERAARQRGAQDVRSLFSLDNGRSFRPFELPIEQRVDPLPVYLAVRHCGYWVDGFVYAAGTAAPILLAAQTALRAALGRIKAGVRASALGDAVRAALATATPHPAAGSFGNSIGLDLDEPLARSCDDDARLEAGAIYSLRAGAVDATQGAIVSALVLVGDKDSEVLWATEGVT
jgi:Xaa-Pro aminopeptidase